MGGDRGGGGAGCRGPAPGKLQVAIYFQEEKTGTNFPREAIPPPPLELSGSAHACPTVEFYFFICSRFSYSYFLVLTDCTDAQVDLCLCCLHATAIRYIRNGVNKANPDKTSQSPQSCSNAKLCGNKF